MSKSRRALQAIVDSLSDQLARGWASLRAARQVEGELQGKEPGCTRGFQDTVYDACVESAILAFARLAIAHKDSISVTYLLNCVQQSPSAFRLSERAAVAAHVVRDRARLRGLQPLMDQVRDYRDRAIAHLDKRYVNHRRAVHAHPPVELDDLGRAFALFLDVLNAYRAALGLPVQELEHASGRDDRAPT